MPNPTQQLLVNQRAPEIRSALERSRAAFFGVGLFSGLINLLALTGSIYMLQLYDRVLPSHSVPTLVGLSVVSLLLYAGYGALDVVRARLMGRVAVRFDRALRDRLFAVVLLLPLRVRQGDGLQPIRDLDHVRSFLAGSGPIALLDLPWMPFYLALVYVLHPWLGMLGAAGALVLVSLTALTEARSRVPSQSAAASGAARQAICEASRRNSEVIWAMGMGPRLASLWNEINEKHLTHQVGTTDVAATYGALSKVLRMILQSAVLGLGAYLAILGEVTPGVMIAASILVARGLAPVEIAIANWRSFIAARQSLRRLSQILALVPARPDGMDLPQPKRKLEVEGISVAAPGLRQPILHNVSFALQAGAGLGVIGPAASGKSTLARAIIGAWLPLQGTIRLDGAALDQWNSEALGHHIGYLPQDIELFEGTVAQNIARFDQNAKSADVIAAANKAGINELILRLPDGYETKVGEGGTFLSAGQRQRVALARALYRDPFLVVLDEPNSNLDAEGEAALTQAISSVRERGAIAVVIAHRPSALVGIDQLLVLCNGMVQAFGVKDDVLRKTVQQPSAPMPAAPGAPGSQAVARLKAVAEGPV